MDDADALDVMQRIIVDSPLIKHPKMAAVLEDFLSTLRNTSRRPKETIQSFTTSTG